MKTVKPVSDIKDLLNKTKLVLNQWQCLDDIKDRDSLFDAGMTDLLDHGHVGDLIAFTTGEVLRYIHGEWVMVEGGIGRYFRNPIEKELQRIAVSDDVVCFISMNPRNVKFVFASHEWEGDVVKAYSILRQLKNNVGIDVFCRWFSY